MNFIGDQNKQERKRRKDVGVKMINRFGVKDTVCFYTAFCIL